MSFVDISGVKIRYVAYNNKLHTLERLADDNSVITLANGSNPLSTTFNSNSTFGKALYQIAKEISDIKPDFQTFLSDTAPEWAELLIKNKVTGEDLLEKEHKEKQKIVEQQADANKLYYETLYAEFRDYLYEYDVSPLELIVATSRCLVADSVREVIRAFVGYFQTVNNFKATNVIAIGSPASGKSFILETALSMIPDEFVHKTIMTEPAFYEEFDGQDLTGHIFFLGDLGGANSDEKTIAFRDLLKELSTDGEVSRTLIKGDSKNKEVVKQRVRGKPALSYSTAHQEVVNEQEKTRSVILTPQPINPHDLLVFNTVMRNHGVFKEDMVKLDQVRESIKGMVYCFNRREYDFFNPYEFNVISSFEDNSDFNRKIQEFDATLEVVTLLDKPYSIYHTIYDLDEEDAKTRLVFASKRDNLNAMNLFDAVDFLPMEARFGDKLIEIFTVFDLEALNEGLLALDEDATFEENAISILTNEVKDWVCEEDTHNWKRSYFYNSINGYFSSDYKKFNDYVFTVSSLKKRFNRSKWLKTNLPYVSDRLRRLYEGNVLIILGKTEHNENVYALSDENGEKISIKIPSFTDKKQLEVSKNLFTKIYPDYIGEFDTFLSMDSDNANEYSLTESIDALFPNLPYIKGGVDYV